MTPVDNEIVELALLVPRWQAEALEEAAHDRGISTGQMLRRMIGNGLKGLTSPGE